MAFVFKSYPQILVGMLNRFISETPVNDLNPGSVLTTFLEAASQEDAEQYFRMYQVITNYYLDTTEGEDLDNRAAEYGLERLEAQKATSIVTISDTAITKRETEIWAGARGPISGQEHIDVENASSFDATGTIIVGRDTENAETIGYDNIINFDVFYRIELTSALTNDHGTEESVIQSQGGDRSIPAGTLLKVPESDTSREILFSLLEEAIILDGEEDVENVSIIAVEAGALSNVPTNTIIEFESIPFDTAVVSNPQSVTNGTNRESDTDLRDRIKDKIQSLSRGTKQSVTSSVLNIKSNEDEKRVVSANLLETNDLEQHDFLYIDDGTGLEPSFDTIGNENVLNEATGGEQFLQLDLFPLIKAEVESQNEQPYEITNGMTLSIEVNDISETLTFTSSDFQIEGSATAYEVSEAINDRMDLVEARTSQNGTRVVVRARANINENIKVTGGTANANDILNFSTDERETLYLYRYNESETELLTKDGVTAEITNTDDEPYNLSGGETLTVIIDGKSANVQTITFQAGDFASLGTATAEEVAVRINEELSGGFAVTTDNGSNITIKSRNENSSTSKVQVTGGSANAELVFDTSEVSGKDKGYTLNRFNGQIELESEATIGDSYDVGSTLTRGFAISRNPSTWGLTNGDTIDIKVDGAAAQTITFLTADFSDITQATALEVAAVINRDGEGMTASATSTDRVSIRTNTWGTSGSIEIDAVTGTATVMNFEIGVVKNNLEPHTANIISGNPEDYAFSEGDDLIVVVDKNLFNTYTIIMDLDGAVSIGDAIPVYDKFIGQITATSQNFNLRFTNDNDLKDFKVKWLTGSNAPTVSDVLTYTASTGEMTLAVALPNTIDPGDTFTIIPKTAKNVTTYLNNTIVSSLPTKAIVSTADNGTKVQIESKTVGTKGAIHVTSGTANSKLGFSTTQQEGRDGYRHYTGIVRKIQHIIDGLDDNLEEFPGIKAAGVQIEVLSPVVRKLIVNVNVTLESGFIISTVKDKVISGVSSYINGLGVGDDVVITEMIDRVMDVNGIRDVEFVNPSSNIAIADNEIARIDENNIIVS